MIETLPWQAPETALKLLATHAWGVLLDSNGPLHDTRARWSWLCLSPRATLIAQGRRIVHDGTVLTGNAWQALRALRCPQTEAERQLQRETDMPFTGGVIGLASYESGLALEGVCSRHTCATPDLVAADYQDVLAFDRLKKQCWWISRQGHPPPAFPQNGPYRESPPSPHLTFAPDFSKKHWLETVEQLRHFIGRGDLFQANLTRRYSATLPSAFDELSAYVSLRQHSPAPFGAYFKSPPVSLLSASVERFIALSATGHVETRPIKGTAAVSGNVTRAVQELMADTKENAENLMITDLMRHDLGRVCRIGSMRVPQLRVVERFTHVLHLVSSITGQLRPECDAVDLLQTTLPPGSVTGAPKHRALQAIDLLEQSARGAYCGTLFRIGHDGGMDSSVIIRSAERCENRLTIGTGSGITWPSDPAREYEETCLKAEALLKALGT